MTLITAPASFAASPPPSDGAPARGPQSDYLTFMRMLTVQMQNQDPLNPMQASDFAVQLATFANVEQATQTNHLLGALLARAGLADLGGWVGMEARIEGEAWFEGDAIELAPDPAVAATRVTLIVRNADGQIVDSRTLEPGTTSYTWTGLDAEGEALPEGRYSFEIESHRGEELLDRSPVASYQTIREARVENGVTYLVLPGGLLIESHRVSGIRQPRATSEG